MKTARLVLWAGVVTAVTAFIALSSWHRVGPNATGRAPDSGAAAFYPAFALTDHQGRAVTNQTYRGKWLLVFFGFTNCPDICPTTLAEFARVMDQLGSDAEAVIPLFISVDPTRDRIQNMAEYVSAFHPAIVGLKGSDGQVASAAKAFKAYYEKQPRQTASDGYAMAYSSAVYLISPQGAFVRTFSFGTSPDEIVKDLQKRL